MRQARVVAQAKINLFLSILAREASGFHQLETLFCRLSLGDRVVVRTTERGRSLDVAGRAVPAEGLGPVESNLAWRAAVAYSDAAGWPGGFAIEIDKRIPVGGGLGGGSADAGAVLRALEALSPAPIGEERLLAIAASLGADVPFLTQDRSPLAIAWGRGERMLALPALEERRCLLCVMPFGVPTADAYGWLAESRAGRQPAASATLLDPGLLTTWEQVDTLAHNDFEPVVAERYPLIAGWLEFLRSPEGRRDLHPALLCGSGATVFALERKNDECDDQLVAFDASPEPSVLTLFTTTATRVEPVVIDD